MNDQQRIETAADNCEVLRARLAKYEDAEGRPVGLTHDQAELVRLVRDLALRAGKHARPLIHAAALGLESQAREIERLNSDYNEACEDAMCVARELERQKMNCLNLLQQLEDLKAQSRGEAAEVVAWQDAENPLYTTAERRVMHDWAGNGYPIVELMTVAQHNRMMLALVARCYQEGAFKTCLECGYQDGHDQICQYHESKRATHPADQVADGVVVSRELRSVLAMILNALDRDAAEGKQVRREMAEELRALLNGGRV